MAFNWTPIKEETAFNWTPIEEEKTTFNWEPVEEKKGFDWKPALDVVSGAARGFGAEDREAIVKGILPSEQMKPATIPEQEFEFQKKHRELSEKSLLETNPRLRKNWDKFTPEKKEKYLSQPSLMPTPELSNLMVEERTRLQGNYTRDEWEKLPKWDKEISKMSTRFQPIAFAWVAAKGLDSVLAWRQMSTNPKYFEKQIQLQNLEQSIKKSEKAYSVLKLPPGSSPDKIQTQFTKFAKQQHPDLGGSAAKFNETKKATDYLRKFWEDIPKDTFKRVVMPTPKYTPTKLLTGKAQVEPTAGKTDLVHKMPSGKMMPGAEHPGAVQGTTQVAPIAKTALSPAIPAPVTAVPATAITPTVIPAEPLAINKEMLKKQIFYNVHTTPKKTIDKVVEDLSGKESIIVYRSSEKPIEDGSRVTPFKEVAKEYSFKGKLDSKKVKISDLMVEKDSGHLIYSPKVVEPPTKPAVTEMRNALVAKGIDVPAGASDIEIGDLHNRFIPKKKIKVDASKITPTIDNVKITKGQGFSKPQKTYLVDKLLDARKEMTKAPLGDKPTDLKLPSTDKPIHIEVPGDGTFDVNRDPAAIDTMLKGIKVKVQGKKTVPTAKPITELYEETARKIGEVPPPIGLGIRKVGVTPTEDVINFPPEVVTDKVEFGDKEIEKQYQAAKGIKRENVIDKTKKFADDAWRFSTRAYPELPNTPEFAQFKNILNTQAQSKLVAKEDAMRVLQGITFDLGKNQFDVFSRKIILDDLKYDLSKEKKVPFGLTIQSLVGESSKIDKIVEANPVVKEAIERRKKVQASLRNDLIKYELLDKDKAANPDYFRHQVIEYAKAKVTGTGKRLKAPSPGYAKARKGTELAINTDYLEAEYEYMTQAMHDIRTAKSLAEIETSPLNIKPSLLAEAKEIGASWRDLIPEGYTTWQPKEGRTFYTNKSIPERSIDKLMEGELPENLVEEFLSVGRKLKEFVVPEGVAKTLDNLHTTPSDSIGNRIVDVVVQKPIQLWKRWVLFNPYRLLKYNYQNTLGDLDAVFMGNPQALKKFPRAISELYEHFYGDKPMTKDMHDFFERGGLTAGLTIQELPEVKESALFKRIGKAKSLPQQLNLVKRWFQFATKASTFRENILRYAAYLDYLDRFKTGNFGDKWMLQYGVSNAGEVDALKTSEDKAAKVATELLGDYANITALGKELRTKAMPFFSWVEINAKRYPLALRNAFQEGKGKEAKFKAGVSGTAKVAGSIFRWFLRATAMWTAFQVWNNTRYPDEEEELSEYDRRRMHLTLGRTKDGRPIILRGQGALGDFAEWFGVNELPYLWGQLADNKISLAEMGKEIAKAPANKLLSGVSPSYKIPIEYVAGKSLFPDAFNPTAVRDKTRNLVKSLSAEDIYDWLTDKPQRSLPELLLKATPIVISEPGENAYWEVQNLKRLFWKKKGKGDFVGGSYSPKSNAMYNYKKALRLKDKKAIEKQRSILIGMGLRRDDFKSIHKKLRPLNGLSKKDEKEFTRSFLSEKDKDTLRRANKFYNEMLTQ